MPVHRIIRLALAAALCGTSALTFAPAAFALSELSPGQTAGPKGLQPSETASTDNGTGHALPSPGSAIQTKPGAANMQSQATPPAGQTPAAETATEAPPVAEIIHDLSKLPEPVRKLRQAIVEAAASGDVERMRPIMDPGAQKTDGVNENDDPIETLKSFSGDQDGLEILAIMLDLLQTGAARLDPGTPEEVYVWPYFAGKPLATLSPPEKVDLLRIITAGDLAAMEEVGNYNFYRVGITPDGKWKFIVSGD